MFDHRQQLQGSDSGAPEDPVPELSRLLTRVRAQVARYVAQRRAQGAPIERVLPEVKSLVCAAQLVERWNDPSDTVMAQVVRWAIYAYYDEPELTHVPRFY